MVVFDSMALASSSRIWIRDAVVADAAAIGALHVAAWRSAYRGVLPDHYLDALDPISATRQWRARISSLPDGDAIAVAEVGGQIAGYIAYQTLRDASFLGMAGEVTNLYLAPEQIGRGVGRALFSAALSSLAARPSYWVVVWVLAANHRARAFYTRAGCRFDGGSRIDTIGGRDVEIVRYARALNSITSGFARD